MNDHERNGKLDSLRRYEEERRKQLGAAMNLVFGLATAATGFCFSRIVDKDAHFSAPGSYYFLSATALFVFTVALSVLATWTRVRDFRVTARKLREELRGAPATKLQKLESGTRSLGRWTWNLFYFQLIVFAIGLASLAIALAFLYRDHVTSAAAWNDSWVPSRSVGIAAVRRK